MNLAKAAPVAADLFRAVAPVLGTALGGPLGAAVAGVAVKVLDKWVVPTGPGPATPEDIVAAVEKNAQNPELALDLKRAELAVKDYELRMKKLDARFDLMKLEVQDRTRAGEYQVLSGTALATFRLGRLIIFYALTLLTLLAVGCLALVFGGISIPPERATVATIAFSTISTIIGAVVGFAGAIINFTWGSSQGSQQKSDQLTDTLRQQTAALGEAAAKAPPVVVPPAPPVVIAPPAAQAPVEGPWRQGPYGGQRWRLTASGVVLEGETEPLRTVGQPVTVRRIWRDFGPVIVEANRREGASLEILVACVAAESRGDPNAIRHEPGYASDAETPNKVSVGLGQLLLSTAADVAGREVTADSLRDPANNLFLAARLIARQRGATGYQPPLVAAAYNAGGLHPPREQDDNPWRLRSTGDHISRFCQFYGDACAVAAEDGWGRSSG